MGCGSRTTAHVKNTRAACVQTPHFLKERNIRMKPLNFYFTKPKPTRLRPIESENHRKVICLLQRRGVDNAHRFGYNAARELLAELIAVEVREKE